MKRTLLIFLTCLLCVSVQAGNDYLDSFTDYDTAVRQALGLDPAGTVYIDTASVHQFTRDGVILLTPVLKAVQTQKTVITVRGINVYTLDTLQVGITSVVWSKGDSVKGLVPVPQTEWYKQTHTSCIGQEDPFLKRPSFFDFDDNKLFIFPSPVVAGDTIRINGYLKVPATDTLGTLRISDVKQRYRPVILSYVVWQAAKAVQSPSTQSAFMQFNMALSVYGWRMNETGTLVPLSSGK